MQKEKADEIKHKYFCVEEFSTNQLATEKKTREKDELDTEKQAAEYAKESGDLYQNIDATNKAVTALSLSGGADAGAFLQTTAATSVRHLAIDMDISPADRDQVMAFLAQGQGYGYVPQSGRTMAF